MTRAAGEDAVDERLRDSWLDEPMLRANWAYLVRLGRVLTGSQQLAEDLAQDAILGLLRRTSPVASPRAYLRRSLVNHAISVARRSKLEQGYVRSLREEHADLPEVDELWPVVRSLPARQRAVLVLRYYEDLSEVEIARVIGCRPGTVKSLAARALQTLRRELGDE